MTSQYFYQVLFSSLLTAGCVSAQYPISDHYDGQRFFNPKKQGKKSFFDFLKWQITSQRKKWPASVQNQAQPELPLSKNILQDQVNVTFVNHATFLIQTAQVNILTDPVYSERTSPVQWLGPKRVRPPGLSWEELPKIDIVLVSHNHYDHMDLPTLKKLADRDQPVFLMPLGNKKILESYGIDKNIFELDWNQSWLAQSGLEVFLTQAHHWSGRGLWDRFESLWGGFYLRTKNYKIYFAGDSGYGDHFVDIASRYGPPDLSFLPIGAYEPRWFMQENHMNPEEAVQAHLDVQSVQSLGMHFGTFQLTDESLEDPVIDLKKAVAKYQVDNFTVLSEGQTQVFQFKKNK